MAVAQGRRRGGGARVLWPRRRQERAGFGPVGLGGSGYRSCYMAPVYWRGAVSGAEADMSGGGGAFLGFGRGRDPDFGEGVYI